MTLLGIAAIAIVAYAIRVWLRCRAGYELPEVECLDSVEADYK